jgi:hypothetical protein
MRTMLLFALALQSVVTFGTGVFAKDKPLLEKIEWTDTWVVNADKDGLPRVLLVGDSIVKGYFDVVEKTLAGRASCARYASSKYIGDPDFLAELVLLLNRYRFDVIHLNNGLHGWDYTEKQYGECFSKLLEIVKKHAKGAVIIWVTTTPIRTGEGLAQFSIDTERVKERNRIASEFMHQHGIPVDDLYGLVADHPEYFAGDGTHYNEAGRAVQGKQVAGIISAHLSNKTDAGDDK